MRRGDAGSAAPLSHGGVVRLARRWAFVSFAAGRDVWDASYGEGQRRWPTPGAAPITARPRVSSCCVDWQFSKLIAAATPPTRRAANPLLTPWNGASGPF